MSASESTESILVDEKEATVLKHDTPPNESIELRESDATRAAQKSGGTQQYSPGHLNNNHHVVPVGVLIVLCTLYLTTAALQRAYGLNTHEQNPVPPDQQSLGIDDLTSSDELDSSSEFRSLNILDRFLEHADVCFNLEIFTKQRPDNFEEIRAEKQYGDGIEISSAAADTNFKLEKRKKLAQQKTTTVKNSHNGHNNKSAKIKHNNQNKNDAIKKEKEQTKKNSTAEPIIYLFALVFIYLLLKAASDINQHYKSKSKGDKRLRRCSLQSYAQTHKQDRRASKDKRQRLLESRCKSVDRHAPTIAEESAFKKPDLLANLRQYTSVDEHGIAAANVCFVEQLKPSNSKPEEISKLLLPSSASSMSNRRCSVPSNSLNYRRTLGGSAAVGIGLIPNSMAAARRTSIAGGSINASLLGMGAAGSSFDGGDPLFPEVKRRVRMINRH